MLNSFEREPVYAKQTFSHSFDYGFLRNELPVSASEKIAGSPLYRNDPDRERMTDAKPSRNIMPQRLGGAGGEK